MKNPLKYTTTAIKEEISLDKEVTQEEKDEESKKIEVSNDAYAVCDFIDKLNNKLDSLRISVLRR